jgi:AraC-like DNA-binding protein
MISLPLFSFVDILLRMMVLGQLLLLAPLLLREPASTVRNLLFAGGLSVAGLVMLTAPIADESYGLLRNLLLLLTDAFAFIFWLLIRYLFDDDFEPRRWPAAVKLVLAALGVVYVYALGLRAGNTILHDFIHALGLLLILHAGFITLRGFTADLLDGRRRSRITVILGVSLYSAVLVIFELVDERFRNAAIFGLSNATVLLLAITFVVPRLFRLESTRAKSVIGHKGLALGAESGTQAKGRGTETTSLTPADVALAQSLDEFIAERGYQQNGLTIKTLARQLACPEHRLRRLINQTRGYRNFNSMLNDLRIGDATNQLADPAHDALPIMSIALNLGYDSIGPFNRAFKARTGQTPREFRSDIQNRR